MRTRNKKERYIPKTGLLGNGEDYSVCRVGVGESIAAGAVGMAAGFAVGWVFYEHLLLALLFGAVAAAVAVKAWRKNRLNKRRQNLLLQFKELLESLATSLGAGSNVPDAFMAASGDMANRFSRDADITRELRIINSGLANGFSIEALLLDFGDRSGLDDILSFANVFDTCYRKGGDIREVLKNTHRVLSEKIDIDLDIRTAVTAQQTEQNAMMAMPVVFVFLLKQMGSDVIDLTSRVGRISTTIAVVIFVVAFLVSRKIMDIKV